MDDSVFTELLGDFLLESRERLAAIEAVLLDLSEGAEGLAPERLEDLRRQLHTLKGNSGMMGFEELRDLAHGLEDEADLLADDPLRAPAILAGVDRCRRLLDALEGEAVPGAGEARRETAAEAVGGSVRVPLARLHHLADLAAELVISRHTLDRAMAAGVQANPADPFWRDAHEAYRGQERLLDNLQHEVLGLRMVPLRSLVGGLRRLVHDEALAAGKSVRLETVGDETPLDRALVEFAGEALGHLVRNAVIHGIEAPAERQRRGKAPEGVVLLSAGVHHGGVEIEVLDDGGGLDVEALERAAEGAGIEADSRGGFALAFAPGVSTHGEADLSAGRGMGLAAVVEEAHRSGAQLGVDSLAEVGTRFTLRLPLSVAVAQALLVRADGEEYAIPVASISETLTLESPAEEVEWRGRGLPLLDLGRVFGTSDPAPARDFAIVVEAEGRAAGLTVDSPGELREIVVKRLDRVAGRPAGVAGSTVLGDGRVVMILDPTDLTSMSAAGEAGPPAS